MPILDLSIDELLTTTRTVRRRLDLTRPVEAGVIQQCLELAIQAPSAGSKQNWHFLVVTDPSQREALAGLYRKGVISNSEYIRKRAATVAANEQEAPMYARIATSAHYLFDHLRRRFPST